MPKSRNRPNHKQKINSRRVRNESFRNSFFNSTFKSQSNKTKTLEQTELNVITQENEDINSEPVSEASEMSPSTQRVNVNGVGENEGTPPSGSFFIDTGETPLKKERHVYINAEIVD